MEMLEKLRQWLLTYPGWGEDTLTVDTTDGRPGSAGLFLRGLQETSRQVDIHGNTRTGLRLHLALHRITVEDPGLAAAWVLDFQDWVRCQSITGAQPVLGVLPSKEQICAYDGQLLRINPDGGRVYQVKLYADYDTYQEGVEDDGSGV